MRIIVPASRSTESGFSLFEIAVAMAILGLISSAVLSVLWQAGDAAAEIRYLDRRDEEVYRFVDLLRETIEALPPDATLSMSPSSETDSGYDELKLENASTAFVFGETVGSTDEVFIALRPSVDSGTGEPRFDLAISRSDFVPDDQDGSGMVFQAGGDDMLQPDDQGRYWLPLLTGVAGATWRFWDEENQEWIDEWTDEERLPPLMEFALLDGGVGVPMTTVFEVPERLVNPEDDATDSNSSGSSSSSSSRAVTTTRTQPSDGATQDGRGSFQRGQGRPGGDGRPGFRGGGRPGGGGPGGRGPGGGGPGGGGPGGGGPSGGGTGSGGSSGSSSGGGTR